MIPREVLFGNPKKAAARISPDGKRLAYLAPVDGVLNVWVGPVDDPAQAKAVTNDTKRGIRRYFWAYTNEHIIYTQDTAGDENWHVFATEVESGKTKNLTPLKGVRAELDAVSHRFPEELLVGLNDRNPQLHDLYRVNLLSGQRKLIQENPGYAGFITDDDFNVRFAVKYAPDGGQQLDKPTDDGWEKFLYIPQEDTLTTNLLGFDKTGQIAYILDSRERNTAALKSWNLETNEMKLLADDPRADISGILSHPTENTIEAVSFNYDRQRWKILDESVKPDFEFLETVSEGDFLITSRTLDDKDWTVAFLRDDGPIRFYHYDRENKQANYLFSSRDDLEGYPLVKMHPVIIPARDGLKLVSYLSLPPGTDTDSNARPDKPLPMVLLVHGGPWARDSWGFDSQHQLLANRGYAVLSVNFRGSTGFGKEFLNAANRQWAAKMHDDLLDAVAWAIENDIAEEDKIAIMGGSYGGYATLVGLTFTPEVFACGVDIVGPSNLITLLNTIPPYWAPALQLFKTRVGDHQTEEGREFLRSRSPLTFVDRIKKPLLIAQGKNDPRVKESEAQQIVDAMTEKQIPVTYVLYPDEGHGFARPENRLSFYAITEAFLAEHLGGRYEPIEDDFEGSSLTVPVGKQGVPGLEEALKASASSE